MRDLSFSASFTYAWNPSFFFKKTVWTTPENNFLRRSISDDTTTCRPFPTTQQPAFSAIINDLQQIPTGLVSMMYFSADSNRFSLYDVCFSSRGTWYSSWWWCLRQSTIDCNNQLPRKSNIYSSVSIYFNYSLSLFSSLSPWGCCSCSAGGGRSFFSSCL